MQCCMYDPTLSFPREKQWSGIFHLPILCWPGVGTMMNDCVLIQTTCFVFSVPQCLEYTLSCLHSDTDETEDSILGSLQQSWKVEHNNPTLALSRKKFRAGGSLLIIWHCARSRNYGEGYLEFSYQHGCGSFHGYPGCKSLLSSCWTSHKGNLFMYYCWVSVSIGRRRVHYFLFHLLAGITSSVF